MRFYRMKVVIASLLAQLFSFLIKSENLSNILNQCWLSISQTNKRAKTFVSETAL